MSRAFLLLVLMAAPFSAVAQTVRYEGSFERAVNRYRWTGLLASNVQTGRWTLQASNQYRSDAFLLFDDRLSFRDVNNARLQGRRPLSKRAGLVLTGRSDWYSLSRVLSQSFYSGLAWKTDRVGITPLFGFATDRRPGARRQDGAEQMRSDAGPAFAVRFEMPKQEVGGYAVEIAGEGAREYLAPRKGGVARIQGRAERAFDQTLLSLDLQGGTARRDAYQSASFLNRDDNATRLSETVESTRSDTLAAELGLEAPVSSSVRMSGSVVFNANNRRVRTLRAPEDALFFDSDFNRRTVDAEFGAVWRRRGMQVTLGSQGGAEIERRSLANESDLPPTQAVQKRDLLRQADFDRGYFALLGSMRLPLGSRFVLTMDGSANSTRHDTPIINLDDRDEVFFNGRAGLLFRPGRVLEVDVQLLANRYHTVYLKSARSAENNVQEGLRLRPSVRWRPSERTRIQLTSEVRATYTVDDFLLPGRRPSDQAARELRYDLSVQHDLSENIRFRGEGRFSDLRLGRFLDAVFAEIPIDTLRTYGTWLRLQTGQRVNAEIGLRTFVRTDFDRAASVRYARTDEAGVPVLDGDGNPTYATISRPGRGRIVQIGPTCALTWPLRNGLLRFDGWYTVQRVWTTLYGDLPEGSAAVIRSAARRGAKTIIPNLAVSMQWNIR